MFRLPRKLRLHMGAALALSAAALGAGPAAATQEYILPTLFDVSGVAADDVLNIRAAPSADAEIIGTLAPYARRVEVVAHDESGRWAQVNTRERSGWVALRYLQYRTDVWEEGELPETLSCFGNEPFWSLAKEGEALVFSTPEAPEQAMALDAALSPGVFRSPRRAILASDGARSLTAVMTPMACSDGMSDRAYGLDLTVIVEDGASPRLLTGCCSIAPR